MYVVILLIYLTSVVRPANNIFSLITLMHLLLSCFYHIGMLLILGGYQSNEDVASIYSIFEGNSRTFCDAQDFPVKNFTGAVGGYMEPLEKGEFGEAPKEILICGGAEGKCYTYQEK